MKHLRHFESIKDLKELEKEQLKPKIGDYVICHETGYANMGGDRRIGQESIENFIDTHIGKIKGIDTFSQFPYEVEYEEKLPTNTHYRLFRRKEIVYISQDKEELEAYLSANKYNL